jgi:hypothetical protein
MPPAISQPRQPTDKGLYSSGLEYLGLHAPSLGTRIGYLISDIYDYSPDHFRKIVIWDLMSSITHFGNFMKDIK